jgi:hypothetical protein
MAKKAGRTGIFSHAVKVPVKARTSTGALGSFMHVHE